ncbi:hypothetical protein BFS35_006540 [Macrococcoides goetzii]|uniref:Uncharacterized protein n=1 Tax=Macrococcoides goetzii TaxID=1891097 RepID=A0A395GAZ9_9STAP|nr:hypothetical protein [Macrococcus goetzii]RAI81221.1 hypothetical protein BFS35_006540 [Macrococcus goetzii]
METIVMRFSRKDVEIMNGKDFRVPDVLLIKPWYISKYHQERKSCQHIKQLITQNQLEAEKTYAVKIKLIDQRTIKYVDQYTYELNYYFEDVLKATVISTYIEEVSHAVSNHIG